jgi:hypothetical protein
MLKRIVCISLLFLSTIGIAKMSAVSKLRLMPLSQTDTSQMGGGASCVASLGGKPVFYDDGNAILRFGGKLIKMAPHDSFPMKSYRAANDEYGLKVYFAKRSGKIEHAEESTKSPMTMRVISISPRAQVYAISMECGS